MRTTTTTNKDDVERRKKGWQKMFHWKVIYICTHIWEWKKVVHFRMGMRMGCEGKLLLALLGSFSYCYIYTHTWRCPSSNGESSHEWNGKKREREKQSIVFHVSFTRRNSHHSQVENLDIVMCVCFIVPVADADGEKKHVYKCVCMRIYTRYWKKGWNLRMTPRQLFSLTHTHSRNEKVILKWES